MNLTTLKIDDFKTVSRIHHDAFSDFFLTSLGIGFLQTYYRATLKSAESISVCAEDAEGNILGFAIGCVNSKGYHKRLIYNNLFPFLLRGINVFFVKPKSLIRLVKNFEKKDSIIDNGDYAELLSIAVLPSVKGTGLGKELIKMFEKEAISAGCNKIALTTDGINNEDVINFYKRSGYVVFYEFVSYPDRLMIKMIKNL